MITFDTLEPKHEEVRLGEKMYHLREASEGVAAEYRNCSARAAKLVDGRIVGWDCVADVQPLLVAGCLFELTAKGDYYKDRGGVPVHVKEEWVRGLPGSIVKRLFAEAKALCPWLDENPNETVEQLEARVTELQGRIVKLRAGEELEPKKSLGSSEGTSG